MTYAFAFFLNAKLTVGGRALSLDESHRGPFLE